MTIMTYLIKLGILFALMKHKLYPIITVLQTCLCHAMNTWLFLFVTKENTSVEWKHPIGQRSAQVASGKVWRKDSAENIPSSEISKNTFLTPLRCITACILWIFHINQNFEMYNKMWNRPVFSKHLSSRGKSGLAKFVLLWPFYTSPLQTSAKNSLWCRIRSPGCWPETSASALLSRKPWLMLISGP